MNAQKVSYLTWITRIIIFILFIVSGVAKLFPVWAFEKQLVDLHLFSWCQAPYFSRFIIATEIAFGLAILQNHFIKRLLIPLTALLLLVFCVHLSIQIYHDGAMNGNCGCFGQLIPMTPLEALIKNIITLGLLAYLYRNVKEKERSNQKFIYPFLIFILSLSGMFLFFPIPPCSQPETSYSFLNENDTVEFQIKDTIPVSDTINKIKTKETISKKGVEYEPKPVHSKFSSYFTDKSVNMDEGKKVICLFAAGCDHCRETAKEICKLLQNEKFPDVYILFMDEETFLINDFFKEAQCNFPYQVIAIPEFWNLLGNGSNTPGVFFLWNGNIIKSFEGTGQHKFSVKAYKKLNR